MSKETIYTVLDQGKWRMTFYYKGMNGTYELFRGKYRHSVHQYFQKGKSIPRLLNDKGWRKYRFVRQLLEGRLKREVKRIWKEEHYAG